MTRTRHLARLTRGVLAGVAFAALVACGGGTEQYDPFIPQRLLAFGDETSAFEADGRRYSVNSVSLTGETGTDKLLDCNALPIWVQSLASLYGFVFPQCNPNNLGLPQARSLAVPGAKVEDLKVQIDALIAAGGFRAGDLATVLVGANDILEVYRQFPGQEEAVLAAELGARGRQLAQQINVLVELGVKVIVATVPDMGLTPYARRQALEFTDTDRSALLSRLTQAFNEQLGVNILLDGRFIALVQADLRTQAMVRSPLFFGLANVSDPACNDTVVLPACDTTTLATNASAGSWMWADETRPGPPVHDQLGRLAIDRARRNPF